MMKIEYRLSCTVTLVIGMLIGTAYAESGKVPSAFPQSTLQHPEVTTPKPADNWLDKKARLEKRRAEAARTKPIDINSASREELKQLPGIGDLEAEKIVAGRPYGSKAWLVSNGIVNPTIYEAIKRKIEARQSNGLEATHGSKRTK